MQPTPAPVTEDTPVAVFAPIAITPALIVSAIKWISGAIVSVIAILTAANGLDRYLLPAKDTDLKALQIVVDAVRQQQADFQKQMESSRDAIARLTLAVDNTAGLIDRLQRSIAPIKAKR